MAAKPSIRKMIDFLFGLLLFAVVLFGCTYMAGLTARIMTNLFLAGWRAIG